MEDRDVLTPEQVADELQLHIQTVYDKLRSGEIKAFKLGRHWRIRRRSLDEYIDKLEQESSPE